MQVAQGAAAAKEGEAAEFQAALQSAQESQAARILVRTLRAHISPCYIGCVCVPHRGLPSSGNVQANFRQLVLAQQQLCRSMHGLPTQT